MHLSCFWKQTLLSMVSISKFCHFFIIGEDYFTIIEFIVNQCFVKND